MCPSSPSWRLSPQGALWLTRSQWAIPDRYDHWIWTGHDSDSKKWTGVSTKGLTQNFLSQVDLRGAHSLKFGQMYLKHGVCIRVMIGKVADIILMAEVYAEGQCII